MSHALLARQFRLRLALAAACLLLRAVLAGPTIAQTPTSPPSPELQEKLRQRDHYLAQARQLQADGRLADAIAVYQKGLVLQRQVFGEVHGEVVGWLSWLARLYQQNQDFAAARQALREVLAIQIKLHSEKDWRVTDARLALAHNERLSRLTVDQRRQVAQASKLNRQVESLSNRSKYTEALPLARRALEMRTELLGEGDPATLTSLNNLGWIYRDLDQGAEAESLLLKALRLRKQVLGNGHPHYAYTLNVLGWLYQRRWDWAQSERCFRDALAIYKEAGPEKGNDYAMTLSNLGRLFEEKADYARAEPFFCQALQARKQAAGEKHPEYARSLNNLALLYKKKGDYAQAEPLYQRALEISKQAQGEQHPDYATDLNNLAVLYSSMGDYARAEPLLYRALAIDKQALGEQHPDYATSLNNLASLYDTLGNYAQAEALYHRALEIRQQALGEQHPDFASSLSDLALLYKKKGDYKQAELLYRRALEIRKKALGEQHPAYASSLNSLAGLYRDKGDYAQAEQLYRHGLQIRKQTQGEQHPAYATSLSQLSLLFWLEGAGLQRLVAPADPLHNLASLYGAAANYARAERLLRQALDVSHANLELAAAAQSQFQQLAMLQDLRYRLDNYLSLTAQMQQDPVTQYLAVLAWKGAVGHRQRQQRLARHQPALAQDFADLGRVSSRLATLALATSDPGCLEKRRKEIQELTEQKERLERVLARRSATVRTEKALQDLKPAQLQTLLPADAALIDFVAYDHRSPAPGKKSGWHWEQRLAAFVVRRKTVARVDLGSARSITEAVDSWRLALQRRFRTAGDAQLGAAVRQLIWQPLEEHLRGARLVLISPDGVLARIPFTALPGTTKDSYLVEEVALAVVPVPQLLPELLAGCPTEQKTEPSLLVVGDVRYDAVRGREAVADSRAAPRSGTLLQWKALEHTRTEVAAIKDSFQRRFRKAAVTDLREEEATEAAIRKEAPVHRYLHLATHGFFAPRELRSALAAVSRGDKPQAGNLFERTDVAGFHPGLLSGLVLAGANRPPEPGQDDGILTALEVETLDLSGVELATLSACETGLGEAAGGEGLLGLQRAFQVAGARSVVAGLWQVDDKATQELMVRFYENLWKRQLPKLEALRQAQLWMLREGAARGMTDVRVPKERLGQEDGRLPPFYWAAFVLSGDWR